MLGKRLFNPFLKRVKFGEQILKIVSWLCEIFLDWKRDRTHTHRKKQTWKKWLYFGCLSFCHARDEFVLWNWRAPGEVGQSRQLRWSKHIIMHLLAEEDGDRDCLPRRVARRPGSHFIRKSIVIFGAVGYFIRNPSIASLREQRKNGEWSPASAVRLTFHLHLTTLHTPALTSFQPGPSRHSRAARPAVLLECEMHLRSSCLFFLFMF